ncbi:hypothetical protein FANTH_9518 [Fusarium anthophilum]|uniref:Ankyrin n=1 Tax=Fusarium anthophilum TaxID=48485 RepID=A0A8H5DYQ8_9HYPO|nr:hypothetical protein FANTH_9518 [Fusarium anthophilum]
MHCKSNLTATLSRDLNLAASIIYSSKDSIPWRRLPAKWEGRTPLWYAAAKGHKAMVRLLFDRGAHTDAANEEWGRTPLWYAVRNDQKPIVRLLLDRGAYINTESNGGRTPLWIAAEEGQEAMVRLLQLHDAQPLSTTSP